MKRIFEEVALEIDRGRHEHREFSSAHEAYAVLLEEVDELWDTVRMPDYVCQRVGPALARDRMPNKERYERMRREALQVAACALRLVKEVCDPRL